MRTIAEWSDATKASLLASVPDVIARNLLGLLLHKDPMKRLSVARALQHPYFTGQKPVRLIGDRPEYDVFISYRVDSDINLAGELYHRLSGKCLKVWWDRKSPEPGQPFEEGLCRGVFGSATMVCILSREAINSAREDRRNISKLTSSSSCDWILLEWRLAAELFQVGQLHSVLPLLVGDKQNTGNEYSDYFKSGCDPVLVEDVVVDAIESRVSDMLQHENLGSPMKPNMTVKDILSFVKTPQGQSIGFDDPTRDERYYDRAMEMAVGKIVDMAMAVRRPLGRPIINIVRSHGIVLYAFVMYLRSHGIVGIPTMYTIVYTCFKRHSNNLYDNRKKEIDYNIRIFGDRFSSSLRLLKLLIKSN